MVLPRAAGLQQHQDLCLESHLLETEYAGSYWGLRVDK